ncbi:hypothetical protein EGX46_00510 (plasmid) [Yersinia pestis]|nr:hypothetical protein EGX46_00510 [Yersinia pestis]
MSSVQESLYNDYSISGFFMWRLLQAGYSKAKKSPGTGGTRTGENESLNNFRSCISHRCYCNGMNLPQFIL